MEERFDDNEFIIEEKLFSLGKKYFIKDSDRTLIGYCEKKSLKIREDIRVFKDRDKKEGLFRIKQKNLLNLSGYFEITDHKSKKTIGYLKRGGLESFITGKWILMDHNKDEIGMAKADSLVKEAVRFKGLKQLPYRYKLFYRGKHIGVFKERVSILRNEYKLQIKDERAEGLDKRLLLSLAILLDAVEDRFRRLGK